MRTVAAIYTSPVKSFALESRDSVQVGFSGIAEDRRFHLINDEGRLLTQRQLGTMATISASYDVETGVLRLAFPDSSCLEGSVEPAKRLRTDVFGRWVTGSVAAGDWNGVLSEFFGTGVRLVRSEGTCEVFDEYPISLLSQASVDFLGSKAGGAVRFEGRRFRPNFLIDGCSPHEEDFWLGGVIRIGPELLLRMVAPDPRCAITTFDPDTGQRDFDTPRLLLSYRPGARAPYFGVYAAVESAGAVSVGDQVEVTVPPPHR